MLQFLLTWTTHRYRLARLNPFETQIDVEVPFDKKDGLHFGPSFFPDLLNLTRYLGLGG